MSDDIPALNRDKLDTLIKKVERMNGNKLQDFSVKEILLMTTADLKDEIRSVMKNLHHQVTLCETERSSLSKYMRDHDVFMAKMTEQLTHLIHELPEKGFCEKVNKSLYTSDGIDKVEVLWNDRRWMKGLFALALALLGLGGLNLIISLSGGI